MLSLYQLSINCRIINVEDKPTSWEIMLETTASVIMSVIDALIYVVLRMAKKHEHYGELVDTTECIMLHPKCCTIQGCYK
jgi:hypothetical protein